MNDDSLFGRIAAISTIIAAVLILAATVVLSMAVDFDPQFLAEPTALITAGLDPGAIGLLRWGSILELFGYFLFLIPLVLYLWYWLRPHNPGLVDVATVCALGSIFMGVVGATVRASIWPSLMLAYPATAELQRPLLQVVFESVTDFSFVGLYAVDSILAGLWWLGTGLVLRSRRRVLGSITAIIGAFILGAGVGWITGIDPLARLELFYFFEPVWVLWLGIVIWRRAQKREPGIAAAAAT